MTTSSLAVTRPRWSAERAFYGGMSLAILAAVCLGFGRSFFLRPWFPGVHVPPERFFLLHGTAFAGWCVLLVVQARLVGARRVDLHRRLGAVGGVLAVAMVVLGATGAIIAALVVSQPARLMLSGTAVWLVFARWLTGTA